MARHRSRYVRHRFPPDILSHAVWLYYRDGLSFRDVEDLLAERGVAVSYETVRQWCRNFGPAYARRLKCRHGRLGDTWFLDEVFVTIHGQRQYLWRAVDQDGDVIDILVQPRRDGNAARRFFRRLLRSQRQVPCRLVTDKLGSYRVAHHDLMPSVTHDTAPYANNRAKVSHQPTRQRERQMRGFRSPDHAQRFLQVHGVIQNLFRVGRHHLRSAHYRMLRSRSFAVWASVTAASLSG
jgi:putative transposase